MKGTTARLFRQFSFEGRESVFDSDKLSEELQDLDNWVGVYRYRDGEKVKKLPISPTAPKFSHRDPSTWGDLADIARLARRDKSISGVGLVLHRDWPVVGIDLDHARDPATGVIADWAQAVIDRFAGKAYIEVSQSGEGLHLLLNAFPEYPHNSVQKKNPDGSGIEMYWHNRYFMLTTDVIEPRCPEPMPVATGEVIRFCEDYGLDRATRTEREYAEPTVGSTKPDEEIIAKCRAAKTSGEAFQLLWAGVGVRPAVWWGLEVAGGVHLWVGPSA